MEKLKSGVRKIRKALHLTTGSLQGTTSGDHTANDQLPAPAPAVQIAALPDGDSNISPATAGSPLFNKLPVELRRRILDASFGGRTLHIAYDEHSVVPYPRYQSQHRWSHFAVDEHCAWRPRKIPGGGKTWFGCVCHRRPPYDEMYGAYLVHDKCLKGHAECGAWAGDIPYKCWVGVVGWLLTCRQAYWEGLDILYGNNTFCIHPNNPERWPTDPCPAFRSIKSLELVAFSPRFMTTLAQAVEIVQMVPSTFPTLQRLYIAFGSGIYPTWEHGAKQTYLMFSENMLPILDDLWRGYAPGSLQLEVGVPSSVFFASFVVGTNSGKRYQGPCWKPRPGSPGDMRNFCERDRIWRTVNATADGGDDEQSGYWISETDDKDMPDAWMVTMQRYWE